MKTYTPLQKAGQKISKWSEKEQKVPKGWELVKNLPALKGFVEKLGRIGTSLGDLGENIKPYSSLAIVKDWSKLQFVFLMYWKY